MELIKCKVRLDYKLFPRNQHNSGDFAIMKFEIVEILEHGESSLYVGNIETFKGNMCEIEWGEVYTVTALEVHDERFGRQFDVKFIGTPAKLETEEQQKMFLSKILTSNQIDNLYKKFTNPIEVIMSRDIESLCQVKGMGVFTAEKVIDKVYSAYDYSSAYLELGEQYGLTNNMIEKLVEAYKSPEIAINKIKDNPYILSSEVEGFGFKRCDQIALNNGFTQNDSRRLLHLSKYILEECANNGHSYIHAFEFMDRIEEETEDLDVQILGEIIKNNNQFYIFDIEEDRYIALRKIYNLEKRVAEELIRIKNGINEFSYDGWEEKVKQLELEQGWEHTDEQLEAIKLLLTEQVLVVTGNAGSGKSSTVSAMIKVLSKYNFAQTALSGRASSRMAEITGEEGYTIHRLLGYNPREGFYYNKENQLKVDIVVVDEISMLGGEVFVRLLEAIPTGSKLVLLGDEGQLESIGTMNILHDLLESNVIKSCRLTKIHRQAQKSGIIEASMKIRNGEQLFDSRFAGQMILGELQDFELNVTKNKSEITTMIENQFEEWMKKVDDICELQVIVPMRDRGENSCFPLNQKLQEIYNPINNWGKIKKLSMIRNKKDLEIRVGDKVINGRNNYNTVNMEGKTVPIFNGNIGIVKDIDEENETMIVDFNGIGEIYINKKNLDGIDLGYCITVHKFQGSQASVIIYALDHSSYMLLNKEQGYTALTRAKQYCIANVENKSLRHAISTSEIRHKRTFLKGLLQELHKNKILESCNNN